MQAAANTQQQRRGDLWKQTTARCRIQRLWTLKPRAKYANVLQNKAIPLKASTVSLTRRGLGALTFGHPLALPYFSVFSHHLAVLNLDRYLHMLMPIGPGRTKLYCNDQHTHVLQQERSSIVGRFIAPDNKKITAQPLLQAALNVRAQATFYRQWQHNLATAESTNATPPLNDHSVAYKQLSTLKITADTQWLTRVLDTQLADVSIEQAGESHPLLTMVMATLLQSGVGRDGLINGIRQYLAATMHIDEQGELHRNTDLSEQSQLANQAFARKTLQALVTQKNTGRRSDTAIESKNTVNIPAINRQEVVHALAFLATGANAPTFKASLLTALKKQTFGVALQANTVAVTVDTLDEYFHIEPQNATGSTLASASQRVNRSAEFERIAKDLLVGAGLLGDGAKNTAQESYFASEALQRNGQMAPVFDDVTEKVFERALADSVIGESAHFKSALLSNALLDNGLFNSGVTRAPQTYRPTSTSFEPTIPQSRSDRRPRFNVLQRLASIKKPVLHSAHAQAPGADTAVNAFVLESEAIREREEQTTAPTSFKRWLHESLVGKSLMRANESSTRSSSLLSKQANVGRSTVNSALRELADVEHHKNTTSVNDERQITALKDIAQHLRALENRSHNDMTALLKSINSLVTTSQTQTPVSKGPNLRPLSFLSDS
ncbi:hypothetical protein [Teredinibacter purpureus]|uniref:hypothetical protein n=1 Tax=Teredinibacter purpureus TaxID=2731756 RepID=UPI0005F8445C|nr:hypothetical protein [Teredinibacter purpureus]